MKEKSGVNKTKRMWIIVIILFVAALAAVSIYAYIANQNGQDSVSDMASAEEEIATGSDETAEAEQEEEDPVEKGQGIEEFVIFGVDTRSDDLGAGTRSDSIMIVHVDYDDETVKVLSIYRDCMVHIEDNGYEKITHAHSYGGPELAVSTINENFDLDIENYITLNFLNVEDLVDEIGGVEMDITEEEVSHLSDIDGQFSGYITEAGTYLLDGAQAVAYSRIRYASGGDYKRSERQRDVLFNIFEKAKTLSVTDRYTLAEDMLDQVNSNYTTDDLTSLLYYMSEFEITDMTAYPQVFYGGTVDGAWVEVPVTLVDMATGIHEFLYGETDYSPSDTVQSYSSTLQSKASTANQDFTDDEEE
ncbi:MAG: LCP family protein [Clostridiales bacterium]|nr:LCP family protein [Clostridiales bacterium]